MVLRELRSSPDARRQVRGQRVARPTGPVCSPGFRLVGRLPTSPPRPTVRSQAASRGLAASAITCCPEQAEGLDRRRTPTGSMSRLRSGGRQNRQAQRSGNGPARRRETGASTYAPHRRPLPALYHHCLRRQQRDWRRSLVEALANPDIDELMELARSTPPAERLGHRSRRAARPAEILYRPPSSPLLAQNRRS